MWSVEWDGEFVVGGDANQRLTPAFRLKEFRGSNGNVRVHRELVSALQLLRNKCGGPLSVRQTEPDGLGAVVASDGSHDVRGAADAIRQRGIFVVVNQQPDGIRVRLCEPEKLPALGLDQALETAFSVTAAFETAGDKFQQITGNFDGAGLSFGPAQVNFASGTLVPLFRRFIAADEDALRRCFSDPDDYSDWRRLMDSALQDQVKWAASITTGRGGHDVIDPWKGYFQAVGRVPQFREIMVESVLRDYGGKVAEAIQTLESMRAGISIDHLRCICSLYDLAVQQNGLQKALPEITQRVKNEKPTNQFELVRIAVEERGRKALEQWRADAVSRRVGILNGVPFAVDDRQRANIHFYLLRNVKVTDVDRLMSRNFTPELARVRQAVASGQTLLA